ncbi:MAG: hypothetical protein H7259_02415 [Cytophagales bacterium]|nr:hypothetical protein [Cytophaga sp.]
MKTVIRKYCTLIAFVFLSSSLHAQLFLEDLNLYSDQILYKKIHDNPDINQYYPFVDGHGNYPDLNARKEFPKKIALISFYVWDEQLIEDKKSPTAFWNESTWINVDGENRLSGELAKYSISSIQHRFDSLGSKVIIPEEFTAEQRKAYDSIQIHYISSYRKKVPDSIQYDLCSASQFRFIKLPVQKLDYKFSDDMALLAKALNVDAVLIVENQIKYNGVTGVLQKITLNMYGDNPIAKPSGDSSAHKKGHIYNEGLLYLSMEMEMESIFTQYDEKKQITYESYLGYDRLLMLMIDQFYINYEKRTLIAPKKS